MWSTTITFNFTDLSHYTHYHIEVSACHKPWYNCPGMKMCHLCSPPTGIVEATAKKGNANTVMNLKGEDMKQSSVKVTWAPPVSPNEQVLAYMVSVFNAMEDTKLSMHCVSSCKHNKSQDNYHKDLVNLSPATKYLTKEQAYTRAPMDMNDIAAMIIFTTEDEESEDPGQTLVILVVFVLVVVMCGIFVFKRVRSPKLPVKQVDKEPYYPRDPSPSIRDIPCQYLVDPEDLKLLPRPHLGEGNWHCV